MTAGTTPASVGKSIQGRLRTQIIVPDAYVDGLEAPDLAASLDIERDERGGVFVLRL